MTHDTPSPTSAPAGHAAADGPLYIDVRSPMEYAGGHVDGALNLPLGQLHEHIHQAVPDTRRELVLYCASGARSSMGCQVLHQLGYTRVRNAGGVGAAALESGRPIRRL